MARVDTYQPLEIADLQAVENLARFIRVADVFEGLGGVLARDVQEDLFASAGSEVSEEW